MSILLISIRFDRRKNIKSANFNYALGALINFKFFFPGNTTLWIGHSEYLFIYFVLDLGIYISQ